MRWQPQITLCKTKGWGEGGGEVQATVPRVWRDLRRHPPGAFGDGRRSFRRSRAVLLWRSLPLVRSRAPVSSWKSDHWSRNDEVEWGGGVDKDTKSNETNIVFIGENRFRTTVAATVEKNGPHYPPHSYRSMTQDFSHPPHEAKAIPYSKLHSTTMLRPKKQIMNPICVQKKLQEIPPSSSCPFCHSPSAEVRGYCLT